MAKGKLFGGVNLKDVASQVKEKGAPSHLEQASAQPTLAAAELALRGRTAQPTMEREAILSVDPARCRPWRYHNRTAAWYTRERCQDLIDSISRDGQLEPALARRVSGEKDYDFELVFGMRRRFACEVTGQRLKLRVTDADDATAAVLMHIENADRQDITPMERALSFATQVEAKVFPTQEALAEALGVSKGQVTKMVKAASLMKIPAVSGLFADKSAVPVEQAYKLATFMERPGGREVAVKAAQNLKGKGEASAGAIMKTLLASFDRSKKLTPVKREYNVGTSARMQVTRNAKGKVTLAFPKGLAGVEAADVVRAVEQVVKDLG